MHKLDAESLSPSICETIEKLGEDLIWYIAQCYDGTSVMSEEFNEVQAKFREKVPHAVYVHCQAQRLNLVFTDCLKNNSVLSKFFSVVQTTVPVLYFLCKENDINQKYELLKMLI